MTDVVNATATETVATETVATETVATERAAGAEIARKVREAQSAQAAQSPDDRSDQSDVIVWLHEDHLSAANPALSQYPDAPVVYVFDEDFLPQAGLAFHRLFFVYESVRDVFASRAANNANTAADCSLRRGRVAEEVAAFARERGARRIVTTATIGDRFAAICEGLEAAGFPIEALPVPLLVPYDARRAPKRFSSWWREVEADAFRP